MTLIMISFVEIFATIAAMVGVVTLVTNWIVELFKANGTWKQVIAWVLSILISVVGMIGGYGLFEVFTTLPVWEGWTFTVLTGFGVGLASNGLYDVPYVQKLLESIMFIIKTIAGLFTRKEDSK
jgi:hypothetical protein